MLRSKSYRRSHQPGLVSETGQPLILFTQKNAIDSHVKLLQRLLKCIVTCDSWITSKTLVMPSITSIGHPTMNRVQNQLEFRTFMNFSELYFFLNIIELL